jgi:hypothetical protein
MRVHVCFACDDQNGDTSKKEGAIKIENGIKIENSMTQGAIAK